MHPTRVDPLTFYFEANMILIENLLKRHYGMVQPLMLNSNIRPSLCIDSFLELRRLDLEIHPKAIA